MYLDYSKLEFDKDGRPERPELLLKTLGERAIGTIPGVSDLKLNIKFSEPSEITFDVPAKIGGRDNPVYDAVTGYKLIETKRYGIYVTMDPSTEADGIMEVKHVKGYSYEKTLSLKKFFLEEGTFNFWNPVDREDTVLGRVLEAAPGWSVGYVSPSLIGRYRTFDSYDSDLLSFLYGSAPEKYRCVFVFDTYRKTIDAYDADEERGRTPIYLAFDNLLQSMDIEEISDELVTAIRPYGADGLDIRSVDPTGSNWIYDLSHFIENGDIPAPLADKWRAWQAQIAARQPYYRALVSMRASASAQLLAAQCALADLRGELETLTAQQSVTIQAEAVEKTEEGKAYQQGVLRDINEKIAAKRAQIAAQEASIASIRDSLDDGSPASYAAQIKAVVDELSITRYFSPEEHEHLSRFFHEQDLTESTFVATSVDAEVSGRSLPLTGETVRVAGSAVSKVDLTETFGKALYTISGGTLEVAGEHSISGDIIRGTLEAAGSGAYVMSLYVGTVRVDGKRAQSGTITMSGVLSGLSSDVAAVTEEGVTTLEGTRLHYTSQSGTAYVTTNVSDYQRYAVEMELYDHAVGVLHELATPTYEFTADAANFLFAKQFVPFREKLELGKGVYLKIAPDRAITPYIIEFTLDFEDESAFSLVFSNRFKRHDYVNTLRDMLETSLSSSRSFDAAKYIYGQTAKQAGMVSKFMNSSLDAAKNTILGAENQSVVINGAGIHIGGDSRYQMRIVDSMIALTDDGWETPKLAIGHFASPEVGDYFGVNADIIGGKLIIGNDLIIENPTDTGVMQFKVDSTGAWLNNSTFVLQKDNGGKILLDPRYGIVAGTGDLFDTDGTTVLPSFIDEDGELMLDKLGMPKNANFFLDLRDGSAYFHANGTFGGDIYANNLYFNDGSGDVKTLIDQAKKKADLSGLDCIDLGGITLDGKTGNINFSGAGSITWGNNIPNRKRFAASTSGPWHDSMQSGDIYCCDWNYATDQWGTPYKFVGTDGANGRPGSDASVTYENMLKALQKAESTKTSFITADEIGAPTLYGAKIYGAEIYAGGVDEKGGQVIGLTDGGINIFDGSDIGTHRVLTIQKDPDGNASLSTGYNNMKLSALGIGISGTNEIVFQTMRMDFTQVEEIVGLHATFA